MKLTVCELSDNPDQLNRDWDRLIDHVGGHSSDLVLLPEMPFYPWFAVNRQFDPAIWQDAVTAHDHWMQRLGELSVSTVLGTRPVNVGGRRINEAFVWQMEDGYHSAHTKRYLPDEEGFWEDSWYDRGDGDFSPIDVGQARIGFMICTEMWFMQHTREYGQDGIHLLAAPRATPAYSSDKWLAGGRAAAVVSGHSACLPTAPPPNKAGEEPAGLSVRMETCWLRPHPTNRL